MKQTLTLLACLISISWTLSAQNNSVTLLQFEERAIDLGDVKHGDIIKSSFHFTNVSQDTVYIDLVSSCDCTDTDWPRKPILPGDKGEIKITFNSQMKEESEVVDVDIYLLNEDPETGNTMAEYLTYKYNLIKD